MDYRIIALIALLGWGAWGFLSKVLSRNMDTGVLVLWSNLGSLIPILAYVLHQRSFRWERNAGPALLAGMLGGIAVVAFYLALKRGPGSVVFPLTGMYLVIPAILGFIFLHEPITARHVAGLACAGAAIFFLAR